jgi:hypothetical protein
MVALDATEKTESQDLLISLKLKNTIHPNHNLKMGLKMAYILSMSEQVKLKAFWRQYSMTISWELFRSSKLLAGSLAWLMLLRSVTRGKSAKCYRKDVNSSGRDKEPTGARNLSLMQILAGAVMSSFCFAVLMPWV